MDLEDERKAEAEMLQDAKDRLAQLEVANRAEANVSAPPAPPTTWEEMEVLKARLSSVEEERDAAVWATSCKRQATMRSTSFDANPCAEGSRRLDARLEHGSPGGPLCWQWPACFNVDCEAVRRYCTHVDVDREWSRRHAIDMILATTIGRFLCMGCVEFVWVRLSTRGLPSRCFGGIFWTTLPGMWLHASVCHRVWVPRCSMWTFRQMSHRQ